MSAPTVRSPGGMTGTGMRIEDYLKESAMRHGAGAAVLGARGYHTYAELELKAARLAAALQARGVIRGDRVMLYMDDGWEAVVSIFAVLKAGGVVIPVQPSTSEDDLVAALHRNRPAAIVTEARLASTLAATLAAASSLKLLVLARGERTHLGDSCLSFEEVVNRISRPPHVDHSGEDTDPAIVLSGKTALTHRCIVEETAVEEISGDTVAIPPLALRDGFCRLFAAIRAGLTLVVPSPGDAAAGSRGILAGLTATDYPVETVRMADSLGRV